MKFRLWSDVHCDFGPPEVIHTLKDDKETVLIIAGDWATRGQPHTEILEELCKRFKFVLFVAGNHDYWGSTIDEVDEFWKKFQNKHKNFRYLNPGIIYIDDVAVIGATLWTDCEHGDLGKLELMRQYMSPDFSFIHDFKQRPYTWIAKNADHKYFIREQLYQNYNDDKVLVVTHHAPHAHCDPAHPFNPGFCCSNMDDLIDPRFVHTWVFGHTHVPVDFELNGVRMISNPRGYKGCELLAKVWDENALDAMIFEI